MKYLVLTLCALGFLIFPVDLSQARPISYAGGTTLMLKNDGDANIAHLHYSPTVNYSIGYRLEYQRDKEYIFHGLQLNNLVKRWNNPESQANLYLKSGVGTAMQSANWPQDTRYRAAGFTGVAADWENRRYFLSYENSYFHAGSIDRFFKQASRVGIAPYIGEYGDLHTWLMVEVKHTPQGQHNWSVTPLIRLFKGTHLGEVGLSNRGDVLFNWTTRF